MGKQVQVRAQTVGRKRDARQPEAAAAAPNKRGLMRGPELEAEIIAVGSGLVGAIGLLVDEVPGRGSGPVALAQSLNIDKVLASRVLKALRSADAVTSMYFMPGPEPLRALVRAAERRGVGAKVIERAVGAVDRFEWLIQEQVGDRSLLDSVLSAWIPEARREFELRRKQAAFKAMSQLKGVQADTIMATCLLSPSAGEELVDVVWVHGLTGLHRVRPGVAVKITSRRMSREPKARRPLTLDMREIDGSAPPLVEAYCSKPTPPVEVVRVGAEGESVFYTLGGDGFGAGSAVDVMFAEVNLSEMKRKLPANSGRGWYFFAEANVPAKELQFDVIAHEALFAGHEPQLRLYDTVLNGVADVFDPKRDLDRLDMLETIRPLGRGLSRVRSASVPGYSEIMREVLERLSLDPMAFRTFRCSVEYPLYGSQVAMMFRAEG